MEYFDSYENELKEDILYYIECENLVPSIENFDELYNLMFKEDSITGNGTGHYPGMTEEHAHYMVLHNLPLLVEACHEFGIEGQTILDHIFDWLYWDVTIRCYLLSGVLYDICELASQ